MTQNIQGNIVTLRPSSLSDRRTVYDWLANSDLTSSMLGEPTFPDEPAPPWEEFCNDHTSHFFEREITERGRCFIIQVDGEAVGQIYFNDIETKKGIKRVELDMWMRAEKYCGKGYGSDALEALCGFLAQRFGVEQFMVQPSARNRRAVRAYEKTGFVRLGMPLEDAIQEWGPNDYVDSAYMVKMILKGANR